MVTPQRPPLADGEGVRALIALMHTLRSPGGCPWDAEQTHESLLEYLLEESYETVDAVHAGDRDALREELGDVLFSVVNVARNLGLDAETALRSAADKFIARFALVQLLTTQRGIDMTSCGLAQLDELWDEAKRMSR